MKDLFERNYHPKEIENRIPERPLGAVSDFVVERLPMELEAIRVGSDTQKVTNLVGSLIENLSHEKIAKVMRSPHNLGLAGLDLKMLEAGIVQHGGKAPEKLTHLVDIFSREANQPPGLTYEELIDINPPGDKRTFTKGQVGRSESDFYEGHRRIEHHLQNGIHAISHGINILIERNLEGIQRAVGNIQDARGEMARVVGYMGDFRSKFSKDHFSEFRPYLDPHPTRGLKGPSGAFSARIPVLELFVVGDQLLEEHKPYLENNIVYFPREGRRQIKKAIDASENGLTLFAQSNRLGNPDELIVSIANLYSTFFDFRSQHYGAVAHHVPQALTGEVKGTAGSDARQFLTERIQMTKELIKKLVAKH